MDENERKDLLAERLYLELQIFKCSLLEQTKEEIYKASYKIEGFVNAYEILLADIESIDTNTVYALLYRKSGILEDLYNNWLIRKDCVYDVLKAYVESGLADTARAAHPACRKERENGTVSDKAS